MKIYTRQGDQGMTSLADGTRVAKNDSRIEAIGTIDELNSWIGLLIDESKDKHIRKYLTEVQKNLFEINSIIAQYQLSDNQKIKELLINEVASMEKQIDEIQHQLQPMKHFILYGGHIYISHIHIARSICRRAERKITGLENILPEILVYFNRLNDYLFVLARYTAKQLMVEEKYWIPKQ